MTGTKENYIPEQLDIIYINFDPTKGREIKKRRPALVMSSTVYNRRTGFVVVCPITSTHRDLPMYVELHRHKIHGQVNAIQLRSLDYLKSNRQIEFVESAPIQDFERTAKIIREIFNFDDLISNFS